MITEGGGIAQLVERLLCKQDVSGSSPLTSTKKEEKGLKFSTITVFKEKQSEDAELY